MLPSSESEIEVIVVGVEKTRLYENTRQGSVEHVPVPVIVTVLPPDSHPSKSTGVPENGPRGLVVAATSPAKKVVPTEYVPLVSELVVMIGLAIAEPVITSNRAKVRMTLLLRTGISSSASRTRVVYSKSP